MKRMVYGMIAIVCCWTISSCNIHNHMPLIKVAQRLEGDWVSQTYLDTLEQTKSPQRAHRATAIRMVQIERDSLSTAEQAVLSFQEGDYWILGRDSLGLLFSSIFDDELKLRVRLLSNHRLQLGNNVFVRGANVLDVPNKNTRLVQKLLFAGTYEWNGKLVEFRDDGQIKGMEALDINVYHPVVYYYNNRSQIDQLWLKKKGEEQRYGFQFKGKKLCIYQLIDPNDTNNYSTRNWQLGKVLFELKKIGKHNLVF